MAQDNFYNRNQNKSYGNSDFKDKKKKEYNMIVDVGWITGKEFDNDTIKWADHFGNYLSPEYKDDKEALTTSQIRKFFGEVKRIQADFEKYKNDVPLLSAKLAYSVGRQKSNNRLKKFYEEFDKCIKVIDGKKTNYDRFVKLLESTVAFHKYHGGKD